MGFSRHMAGVGVVAVLILINVEFILRRTFDIGTSNPSDPIYNYKPTLSSSNRELFDRSVNTIRNPNEMNLSTNATTHMGSSMSFMKTQEAIQRTRRAQVRDTCAKNNMGGTLSDILKSKMHRLIVDEKYKLIYCSVPKVASTSWKRVLLVLKGIMKDTYDLPQAELNNKVAPRKLKYLQFYPEKDVRMMLKEYTKFLVVREPFSRVLSAFRNKLDPNSDFRNAEFWQKGIGMRILRKYKPFKMFKSSSRPNFKKLSTPSGVVRYDLNLGDFVKFLVNPQEKNDNEHWDEIHKLCSPCLIEYDVVSKFETLEADAEYILRLVHADSVVEFPSSTGSSPTNSSKPAIMKSYFKDVTQKDLEKLYNRFKLDFELFGYEKPDILL